MPTSTRKLTPALKAKRVAAHNATAEENLVKLVESVTQREWLEIRRGLDMTRKEVGAERGLTLIALAYVKDKRENGVSNWDVILDMTDDQLARFHGFIGEDDDLEPEAPAES